MHKSRKRNGMITKGGRPNLPAYSIKQLEELLTTNKRPRDVRKINNRIKLLQSR